VAEKLAAIRGVTAPAIIVDSGSTTTANIHSLLTVGGMPMKLGPEDAPWFVTPTIVTNAPGIVYAVCKSKYGDRIPLWIIGGVFHPELWSTCGSVTEQSLQCWGACAWKAEVALIGTTRCFAHAGAIGFACDNREEAQLKAKLLQMGCLRVIIMDSSKLLPPEAGHLFAPLSSSSVDLLVTDDGKATGAHEKVNRPRVQADKAGVAVITLETKAVDES